MTQRIDAHDLRSSDAYRMLIDSIVPRPIAWTTTLSNAGVLNLAPFSYFAGLGSKPPSLMISVANKRDGTPKDTLRNIRERPEMVVHIVSSPLVEQANASAIDAPENVSEVELLGLTPMASTHIEVPRIAEARVAMECRVAQIIDWGEPPGCGVVFAEVLCWHLDDKVLDPHGRIDPLRLDPVGRMGGSQYCSIGTLFSLARPTWADREDTPISLGKKESS